MSFFISFSLLVHCYYHPSNCVKQFHHVHQIQSALLDWDSAWVCISMFMFLGIGIGTTKKERKETVMCCNGCHITSGAHVMCDLYLNVKISRKKRFWSGLCGNKEIKPDVQTLCGGRLIIIYSYCIFFIKQWPCGLLLLLRCMRFVWAA